MDWTDSGAEGAYRFISRVFRYVSRNADRLDAPVVDEASDRMALRKLHQSIHRMTDDFESRWHFNTSIAGLMELLNVLYDEEQKLSGAALSQILPSLVLLLGPFAPFAAEEMWETLGRTGPVFKQPWPKYDPELEKEDAAEVIFQVNGKLRGRLTVPFGADQAQLQQAAMADPKVQPFLEGKQIVKVIVVPDKLVNLVVK
jgi:leucyl-tRNA synthetase